MIYRFSIPDRRRVEGIKLSLTLVLLSLCTFSFARKPVNEDTAYIFKLIPVAEAALNAGKLDSAIQLFGQVITYSTKAKYTYGLIKGWSGLALSESNAGNRTKALGYYETSIKICDTFFDKEKLLPSIYNNIAVIYHYWGNYHEAIRYYLKAIHIREKSPGANIALEKLYNNMAALLSDISQFEKTLYYLKKSEYLAQSRGNFDMLASIMQNQGTVYAEMGDTVRSKTSFQRSLKTALDYNIPALVHKSYINLANLSLMQNQPEQAIGYLKKAMALKGNVPVYQRGAEAATFGNIYLRMQDEKAAAFFLKKALTIAEQYDMSRDIITAHQFLAKLYVAKGDYFLAYQHQERAWRLSDSINNKEKTEAIMGIETSYRTALKDKEIMQKELLINRQQNSIYKRNAWIGITLACLFGVIIFMLILRRSYRHKQALKDERMQRLIEQQELNEMKTIFDAEEKERNRIGHDLHDGIMIQFSVVKMNMSALLGEDGRYIAKEKIEPLISKLDTATQSLRKAAHFLMPDMLLENGLSEAIHYLCSSLQEDISFSIRLEQLDVIPRFNIQFELVVYRITQELLQNVIKHAQATEVYLQLSYSNGQLGIEVEDNGIGIDPDNSKEHTGMGLKSIKARVQSLNGHLYINTNTKGTCIGMEFDMDPEAKRIGPELHYSKK